MVDSIKKNNENYDENLNDIINSSNIETLIEENYEKYDEGFFRYLKEKISELIFENISGNINNELLQKYLILSSVLLEKKSTNISYKVINELEYQKRTIEQILDLKKNELESTIKKTKTDEKYEKQLIELLEVLTSYGVDGKNISIIDAMEKFKGFGEISQLLDELFPNENITHSELVDTIERLAKGHIGMKKLINELIKIGILEKEVTSGKLIINGVALSAIRDTKIIRFDSAKKKIGPNKKSRLEGDPELISLSDFDLGNKEEEQREKLKQKLDEQQIENQKLKQKLDEKQIENQKLKQKLDEQQIETEELQKIINWLRLELTKKGFTAQQIKKIIESYEENQ